MIVAEELTKKYGSRTAVDRISFTVPQGEVVGFLGPNGAGKSTTLRMVTGYLPPTDGYVSVGGFDVFEDPIEAKRRMGYMPEAVPLYPEMRVEEYLAFRAEIKGVRRNRSDAVKRAMKQADVTAVARQLIGELSKGTKQRVGLADALVSEPEILVLDEPTAGLDPNQILHVRELIKSLGRKHTILLSTHILPEVEAVCSRVLIIARGRLVAEGTSEEIRTQLASGGRTVMLVVRGEEATALAAIEKTPGATVKGAATRLEGEGTRAVLRFEVELHTDDGNVGDRVEELVSNCVRDGLAVRGAELSERTLESIFQELTTQEESEPRKGRKSKEKTA